MAVVAVPSSRVRRVRAPGAGGFTLLELTLVVILIGVIAAIAGPRFANSVAFRRAEAAAARIAKDLDLARRHAFYTSASRSVSFDESARSYTLDGISGLENAADAYTVRLGEDPYGCDSLTADFDGKKAVSFDAFGVASAGGKITIHVGGHRRVVRFTAETGVIDVVN